MGKQDIVSTLQRLISGIQENIVIFDGNGTILHASAGLSELLLENELEGRPVFDFLEGKAEGVKMWLENLSHAHFKDVKIKMLRKGQPFPARLRMVAWSVSDNEFVVMASIVDGTYIERRKRDLLRKRSRSSNCPNRGRSATASSTMRSRRSSKCRRKPCA